MFSFKNKTILEITTFTRKTSQSESHGTTTDDDVLKFDHAIFRRIFVGKLHVRLHRYKNNESIGSSCRRTAEHAGTV